MALKNIDASTNADIIGLDNNPTLTLSTTTIGPSLFLKRSSLGSASIALLQLNVSGASCPVIELQASSFVSCTTIQFITGGVNGTGAIRVKFSDGVTYGWIPVLPSGAVTAANAS